MYAVQLNAAAGKITFRSAAFESLWPNWNYNYSINELEGGFNESFSMCKRNARAFVHLLHPFVFPAASSLIFWISGSKIAYVKIVINHKKKWCYPIPIVKCKARLCVIKKESPNWIWNPFVWSLKISNSKMSPTAVPQSFTVPIHTVFYGQMAWKSCTDSPSRKSSYHIIIFLSIWREYI